MAEELFRVRCTQGFLVITDDIISIELGKDGNIRQAMLYRAALVGVESKMGVASLFGMGGGTNLTFRGQGADVLHADLVKPSVAREIVSMLKKR